MTIREAVSQIRTMYKLLSSDNLISDRAIANELKANATLLIKREISKMRLLDTDNIFTELPCIEMQEANISECASYSSPCKISRSKKKIPKFVDNTYGPVVQGVFTIDKKKKFTYMDPNRYVTTLSLYNTKGLYFWRHNGYLYVSDPNIEKVTLIAYFEGDFNYFDFICNHEQKCAPNPLDLDFKCPAYLQKSVFDLTRDTFNKTYKNSVQDLQEDDLDTAK